MKKCLKTIMIIHILCFIILSTISTVSAVQTPTINSKQPTAPTVIRVTQLYNEPIGPVQQHQTPGNGQSAVGLDALDNPDDYIEKQGSDDKILDIGNIIVGAVKYIGEAIAVTILIVLGIKYVLASVEEKAEYKQTMIPYVVGAILIFGGAVVTDLIYKTIRG